MKTMTSRQRMLAVLKHHEADYLPCCFMSFTALRRRCGEDMYALSKAELEMGLDSMLFIPSLGRPQRREHPDLRGLPIRFNPAVIIRQWKTSTPDGDELLYREYQTPAGPLSASVRLSDDWPHGERLPFIDDYQVPRAVKPLVTSREDLEALRFLLVPPAEEDLAAYRQDVERAHAFVEAHGALLAGGWGVGMDMANWLCGVQNVSLFSMTEPEFMAELVEMIHVWNRQRMEAVLSARVDLFIRRAWYEGCDFITPRFFKQVVLPRLKAEVDLAHEYGAKFGYICSSGTKPMLDFYKEAGIDVLIGVDPIQGTYTDMPLMKQKLGGQVSVWGGVSGAITVEMGSEEEIRAAVREAVQTLGKQDFILSPVDNITVDTPQTWKNIEIFMDEWRRCR